MFSEPLVRFRYLAVNVKTFWKSARAFTCGRYIQILYRLDSINVILLGMTDNRHTRICSNMIPWDVSYILVPCGTKTAARRRWLCGFPEVRKVSSGTRCRSPEPANVRFQPMASWKAISDHLKSQIACLTIILIKKHEAMGWSHCVCLAWPNTMTMIYATYLFGSIRDLHLRSNFDLNLW